MSTILASVPHDCSVDVSAAIQGWIDSSPDEAVLSLIRGGCYRVDETLFVENRNDVVIDGHGATLRAMTRGDRTRQQLVLSGGRDLTVRNLTVWGANPTAGARRDAYHRDLEAQHAFQVSGATDVVLDHVQAHDVYGDFVYIGPADGEPSRNVTVTDSKFDRSGRQGISITDAENVTITGNSIGGAAQCLFDIELNRASQIARSIRIIGNVTGRASNYWLANKGASGDIGDIEISGNRMAAPTGGLIFVFASGGAYRGPYLIKNNSFLADDRTTDEGSSGAMFFAHARDVTISGNRVTFPHGANMPAVEVRDSHRVRTIANAFTNSGRTMLTTGGSTDVQVG